MQTNIFLQNQSRAETTRFDLAQKLDPKTSIRSKKLKLLFSRKKSSSFACELVYVFFFSKLEFEMWGDVRGEVCNKKNVPLPKRPLRIPLQKNTARFLRRAWIGLRAASSSKGRATAKSVATSVRASVRKDCERRRADATALAPRRFFRAIFGRT